MLLFHTAALTLAIFIFVAVLAAVLFCCFVVYDNSGGRQGNDRDSLLHATAGSQGRKKQR
jgi:hypothetical protein